MISSPCLFTVRVCVAVSCDCSLVCFSISAICCLCWDGAEISMPRMMSRISDWVRDATFTLEEKIHPGSKYILEPGRLELRTSNSGHCEKNKLFKQKRGHDHMMLRSKIWCRHFYLPYQEVINNNQIPYKAENALIKTPGHSL